MSVCILPSTYTEPGPDGGTITNINDGYSGFHGVDGVQTVVGNQALAFVRQRHGLPNGDIDRIKRQQQFLGSVFRTATKVNHFLFNPPPCCACSSAIKDSLTLDQDTSLTDLEKLGLRLRGVDPSKVTFETIPQRGLEFTDTNLGAGHPVPRQAGGTRADPQRPDRQRWQRPGARPGRLRGHDRQAEGRGRRRRPRPPAAAKVSAAPTLKVTVPAVAGAGHRGERGRSHRARRSGDAGARAAGLPHRRSRQRRQRPTTPTSEVHYAPGDKASARNGRRGHPRRGAQGGPDA